MGAFAQAQRIIRLQKLMVRASMARCSRRRIDGASRICGMSLKIDHMFGIEQNAAEGPIYYFRGLQAAGRWAST
jgi:hypothetical protein